MSALLFLLLPAVLGENNFGVSYMTKDSKLCKPWTCLNQKLNLPYDLPPRDLYTKVLKSILPENQWQDVVENTLDDCYNNRSRRYTNTCPGQALLHCVMDNLIENCPDDFLRKEDACAPLTSLAGFKYMFSQSRYENLNKNLPQEKRPEWFLRNYFNVKCCNVPNLFNSSVLAECGFNSIMHYYSHAPNNQKATLKPITPKIVVERVQFIDFNEESSQDPLECCDLSGFIEPSWRQECGFKLQYSGLERLVVENDTVATTTTTSRTVASTTAPPKTSDVKIVPHSCEKETCVFTKLNIMSDSGAVDLDAFSKLLDNMTSTHPQWKKAKARVITNCISKPLTAYSADCDINKVLSCTFDILSENCPHAKKDDPCRHSSYLKEDTICQISSSKIRPKNRRQFCGIPNLVNHKVLSQCGLASVSKMEFIPDIVQRNKNKWQLSTSKYSCKSTAPATRCVLNKMDTLNKYGFIDYFKMKDKIRHFTSLNNEWFPMTDFYMNTFADTPMYGNHCTTQKKTLNIIDAMLMTCPIIRQKNTPKCTKQLNQMLSTMSESQKQVIRKAKVIQNVLHFTKVLLPKLNITKIDNVIIPSINLEEEMKKKKSASSSKVIKKPFYDYGLLNWNNEPKVEILDLKATTKKPLVILPVYLRYPYTLPKPNDGIFRSGPSAQTTFDYNPLDLQNRDDFIRM